MVEEISVEIFTVESFTLFRYLDNNSNNWLETTSYRFVATFVVLASVFIFFFPII